MLFVFKFHGFIKGGLDREKSTIFPPNFLLIKSPKIAKNMSKFYIIIFIIIVTLMIIKKIKILLILLHQH